MQEKQIRNGTGLTAQGRVQVTGVEGVCTHLDLVQSVGVQRDKHSQFLDSQRHQHPHHRPNKMAEQPVAEVFTFPTDPAQFETDDRISFSKLDNKYIAVQESDGTEFEFDAQLRRWIPLADEDEEALMLQQQSGYGAASPTDILSGNGKKRKQDDMEVSAHAGPVQLEPPHDSSTRVSCFHHSPRARLDDGWAI